MNNPKYLKRILTKNNKYYSITNSKSNLKISYFDLRNNQKYNSNTFENTRNKKSKNIKYSLTNNNTIKRKNNLKKILFKEKKTKSINEIFNKLIKLKHKLNKINIIQRQKPNLFGLYKTIKSASKNKYISYIDDYYKNKLLLRKKKIKSINCELENNNIPIDNYKNQKQKNDINNYKKSYKFYNSRNKIDSDLEELSLINKNKHHKGLSSAFKEKFKNSKNRIIRTYNSEKRTKRNRNRNRNKINNIYFENIRDNEIIDLIKRYKISLVKNKKEEMTHFKSLVFPFELINYLIKMKKELTIDKYRNEYLNKLERYRTENILNPIKGHKIDINEEKNDKGNQNKEKSENNETKKIAIQKFIDNTLNYHK
jgi:predicted HTH domain antitoxin